MPLDPKESAIDALSPTNVPAFLKENPNIDSVRLGLNVADEETRDKAGDEADEDLWDDGDEPEDTVEDDDIEFENGLPIAPELAAMHSGDVIYEGEGDGTFSEQDEDDTEVDGNEEEDDGEI